MKTYIPTLAGAGRFGALAVALLLAAAPHAHAQADTIVTSTIGPQSLDDPGVYPTVETIGNFTFTVPAGEILIGATVSGMFGNSVLSPNTAAGIYTVGGVDVFTCNLGDACWGSSTETGWSYNFTPDQLAQLTSGDVAFGVEQTAAGQVQTDYTTLTLDFGVPEPGSLAVFGAALLGAGLIVRRARA